MESSIKELPSEVLSEMIKEQTIPQESFERLEKDLKEELKLLKAERRYHNRFVKDPLQNNLEVPLWALNERKEITAYLNDFLRNSFSEKTVTEQNVWNAQRQCRADKSKDFVKYYIKLVTQ